MEADNQTQDTDLYVTELEDLMDSDFVTESQGIALEHAQDAVVFCQSLWNLFRDQALHTDDGEPDFVKMEQLIDALNGEIAAAVLFLCNNADAASKTLLMIADNLEKNRAETVNEADNVPQIVVEGNRRLAKRIKNTNVIMNAKRITRVVSK